MANEDFRLDIALGLTPASLKAIQSDINNAIRQINPELNIDLGKLEEFQKNGLQAIIAHIGGVDLESARNLRKQIENVLDLRINKLTPSARAKRELKRQLEEALRDVEAVVKGTVGSKSADFGTAGDVTPAERGKGIEEAEAKLRGVLNQIASAAEEERKELESRTNEARKISAKERDARNRIFQERLAEAKAIAEETLERTNRLARLRGDRSAQAEEQARKETNKAYELLATHNKAEAKVLESAHREAVQIFVRDRNAKLQVAAERIKEAELIKQENLARTIKLRELKRDRAGAEQDIDNNAAALLSKFNTAEAKARQESIAATNKVADERIKEAAAIREETEARSKKAAQLRDDRSAQADKLNIDAEKALARAKAEQAKILRRQITEALDSNKAINQTNREIQSARERLVDAIRNQVKVGNLKPEETSNAQRAFKKAIENAATGFGEVIYGLPGLRKALVDAASSVRQSFANISLNKARAAAKDLGKELEKQKARVAAATKEVDLQNKSLATPDKRNAARADLLKEIGEQRNIERLITQKTREVAKLQAEVEKALKTRLANERAAVAASRSAKGGTSAAQKGKDFTFRGVGDITKFGSQLDPRSLEKYVDILQDSNNKTKTATQLQSTFATSIQKSSGFVARVRDNLNSATRSAFQFGEQSTDAARRLLAWAGPATFIFSTISALKDATKQLTEIDSSARRLAFFENATLGKSDVKGAIGVDFDSFNKQIVEADKNTKLFINTSSNMGIALNDVIEATLTASRVGQKLTQTVTDQNGKLAKAPSQFLNTVLSLVRLEGGALKAEDAVNSLNAIDIQFFSKLKKDLEGADLEKFSEQLETGLAAAGSLLAVVAAKSAFSVRELADATARVGAAFANIQGTGLPQVITLIGEASSATGANVGRLSTALRQVLTFSVQNSEAIKKSFNIDVIDAQGGVAGFEAVLKVLRKINELSGTEKAVDLAKLIGDRRNVADIQSLAVAVASLESEFGRLSDTETEARIVQSAVEQQLKQDIVAADSMQAAVNRLNTEFVSLSNNSGLGTFFKELTVGAARFVAGTREVIDLLSQMKPLLAGVAAFTLAKIAPKIGAGVAGFVGKAITNTTKEETATAVQNEINGVKAVNAAQKEGLLTAEQARVARIKLLPLIQQQKTLEIQITQAETLLGNELRKSNVDLTKRVALEAQIEKLKIRQGIVERQNAVIRNNTQQQVLGASFGQQLGASSKLAGVAAAAAVVVTIFGEKISKGLSEDKTVQKGINSALQNSVTGAATGAALGSVIPGIGTAAGALIGGLAGVGLSVYETLVSDVLADAKQKEQELEARRKGILAGIAQERIAEKRKSLEQKGKDDRLKIQEDINRLTEEGLRIHQALQAAGNDGNKIEELTLRGLDVEEERSRANLALKEEELKVEKQKLGIVEQINEIRRREQSFLTGVVNLEKTFGALVGNRAKTGLALKFNKLKMEREIESLAERAEILLEKREISAKLGASFTELSGITQEIADINAQISNKRREAFGAEIEAQEKLVELASNRAQKQISAWQEASKSVVSAFADVAAIQRELADNFFNRGKAFSDLLGEKLREVSSLLEEAGGSVAERLSRTRDIQQRRLSSVQGAAGAALSRLRQGAAAPFGSTGELRAAAENVATLIGEAGKRGHQEVFDEESKLINERLAILRTEAENSRTLFELRISQTKAEIDIRRKLVSEEISILKERQEIERALNKERIKQQEDFGSLILEGPEAFLAVAKDIGNARKFFKGVGDLSIKSLDQLAGRAEKARETGQFSGLQSVLKGLEALQKFGRASLVSGSSNSQLESVFKRIQGESSESIAKDLKRQQEELNQQTALQKQIELRERQQATLAEAEIALQQAQLGINTAAQDAAIKQRDVLITLMNESISEQRSGVSRLIEAQVGALIDLALIASTNGVDNDKLASDISSEMLRVEDNTSAKISALESEIFGQVKNAKTQEERDALVDKFSEGEKALRSEMRESLSKLQNELTKALAAKEQQNKTETALRDLSSSFQNSGRAATAKAESERQGIGQGLVESSGSALSTALQQASEGVRGFNNQLRGVADIQNRMGQILNERFAPMAGGSATVSGSGSADAIARIEELTRRTSNGGVAIQRSKEFNDLKAVIEKTGGSDAQRARFAELKKTDINPRSFGPGQSGDVARNLLKDPVIRSGLEDGFRGLLQGGAGGDSDLVRQLKEARGSRERGAKNLDPERVKEILSRGGLSGLARDIDSRGEADQKVDNLLRFSEELNRTPERLSERATDILKDILAVEVKEGFKEIAQVIQAQRAPVSEEEKNAANARGTKLDIFNEQNAVDFANRFNEAFKEKFDERARVLAEALGGAIRASLQNNSVKIDIPALEFEMRSSVTNILNGDAFLDELENKLTGFFGKDEDFKALRDKIKEVLTIMVNNGQLPPDFSK